MMAVLIAQTGDALQGASLTVVIVAVISGVLSIIGHIVSGYFSVKNEHRMTRIETKLENLPCIDCPKGHSRNKCWHPD